MQFCRSRRSGESLKVISGRRGRTGRALRLKIRDEPPKLVERVGLHEDVVLGEQEGSDLGQLAHGG